MRMRRMAQPLLARLYAGRVVHSLRDKPHSHTPGPLIVSGLLSEAKGISRAAQLTIAGLEAAGFNPIAHDLRPLLAGGARGAVNSAFSQPGGVWLMHVNAPEAMRALASLPPALWRDRYRIGYWAYELARIPVNWIRAAQAFDEIWVPSRFVADALAASGVARPVRIMPHPAALRVPAQSLQRREGFTVLAMGDFASSAERKNLAGAIAIYTQAFPDAAAGQRLIIKTHSGDLSPAAVARLARLSEARPDISTVDRAMPHEDVLAMIASADVVISPHRCEGYGLVLAEALLLGVPVLATGWSGNMDFMADAPELLIEHTLIPVVDPNGVYRLKGTLWADPSIPHAIARLRALHASPERGTRAVARTQAALRASLQAWSADGLSDTALARLVLPSPARYQPNIYANLGG
jgi:hypothetical protein